MVNISHPLSLPKSTVPPPPPTSPPHPTFPPSQSDPRPGTEGTGLPSTAHGSGSGDNRSRGPCRALQFLQGSNPPLPPSAITHLRRMGKAHSRPPRRSEATGTVIPQSYAPLSLHLSSFSSPPRATSCTCDTTDSLMLHYPYTSLSMAVSL